MQSTSFSLFKIVTDLILIYLSGPQQVRRGSTPKSLPIPDVNHIVNDDTSIILSIINIATMIFVYSLFSNTRPQHFGDSISNQYRI